VADPDCRCRELPQDLVARGLRCGHCFPGPAGTGGLSREELLFLLFLQREYCSQLEVSKALRRGR
jgi:hypothetical protein